MRTRLLSFFLLAFSGWVAGSSDHAPASQSRTGDLEITADWAICLPRSPHRALARAARDLQSFMHDRHGLDLKIVEGTAGRGVILALDERPTADQFSLRIVQAAGQLRVEGSTPRAVYQGVLLLEDQLAERMRQFFLALKQGLHEANRDIPLIVQPHGSSRGELDEFFDSVPREVEITAGNWASWSLTYPDPLEVDLHVLSRQRATGRRTIYYQPHFFGFDVAPTAEFPLPYYLADRLERARGLGLDVLNTLGGMVSPPVKEQSVMQELYRQFLLEPQTAPAGSVDRVARNLGGPEGGALLVRVWKDIHAAVEQNGRQIGFALGTEYTSRRALVRPLVPDASALSPDEREWWLAHTFGGNLRFGHAHLFRAEDGLPPEEWYVANRERSLRACAAFQRGAAALRAFIQDYQDSAHRYPYLGAHERQIRFLAHVYATGANLYEGQRILDKYSRKSIEDDLKKEVAADVARFRDVVTREIENSEALLRFAEEGGDIGMVLLPEEITWGFSTNFPELLRRKIEIMRRRLPETEEVLSRWFDSEY